MMKMVTIKIYYTQSLHIQNKLSLDILRSNSTLNKVELPRIQRTRGIQSDSVDSLSIFFTIIIINKMKLIWKILIIFDDIFINNLHRQTATLKIR